jgi:putative PIN family toxin of toxin-antitoxin system
MQRQTRFGRSGVLLAVVDTNVWISGLINRRGGPAAVIEALRRGEFSPVVTPSIIEELARTLGRPRFALKFAVTEEDVRELVVLLRRAGHHSADPPIVSVSRDPRDDIFIAAAIAAGAECLVTRDDDLKGDEAVGRYLRPHGIEVLTVRRFLARLEAA